MAKSFAWIKVQKSRQLLSHSTTFLI